MKTNKNMMLQELNDTELDMVNGGGFFSSLADCFKDIAPAITEGIKDCASTIWETTKFIVTAEDTLY